MILEPRKSEYGLVSVNRIKYAESSAIAEEVAQFLKAGGQIKTLGNGVMSNKGRMHTTTAEKLNLSRTAEFERRVELTHQYLLLNGIANTGDISAHLRIDNASNAGSYLNKLVERGIATVRKEKDLGGYYRNFYRIKGNKKPH